MITLSIQKEGPVLCVKPEGRLDTLNSTSFNDQLQPLLEGLDYLVIDFSACGYLSSTGIRTLMSAAKKLTANGGSLMLASLTPEVSQVIEMSGLHKVFRLHKDVQAATSEVLRIRKNESSGAGLEVDGHRFTVHPPEPGVSAGFRWSEPGLAGYNELQLATGTGSPAETLFEDEENQGIFVAIGRCGGFLPFGAGLPPEFRVIADPATGGVFVEQALSFQPGRAGRVISVTRSGISLAGLIEALGKLPAESGIGKPEALLIADFTAGSPSLIFGVLTGDEEVFRGAGFRLNTLFEQMAGEPLLSFTNRMLTLDNIEEVYRPELSAVLDHPAVWTFGADEWHDAGEQRIRIEVPEGFEFDPFKAFLTRRLYTDSGRVVLKPLHGGYSAQTFQVDSFDPQGRKLRPTVLKIGGRAMITREADHCHRYAMPYILNNSAMVLGTSFHCEMGALRYNFVGIGGEGTELKWLLKYFQSWSTDQLVPLFDKIFLHILKPWYGQPRQEDIFPYRDQDPTLTFFPKLCTDGEALLGVPADVEYMTISETGEKRLNPYWFLKHEYPARREQPIRYWSSICHGDLNMQNILLDPDMNVYLIDFSETKPRSVISDFARLEAIFMVEQATLETDEDLKDMIEFTTRYYDHARLDQVPEVKWTGRKPEVMHRNLVLTARLRSYAAGCVGGDPSIVPYYLALLEWILPIVSYYGTPERIMRLSAYVSGMLCRKVREADHSA